MNKMVLTLATALIWCTGFAHAESLSVADNNSSLRFTRDNPEYNLGTPADPMQLPRTVEWIVDGRRILVYPSTPSSFLDIGHLHPGAHVAANQIHAQGPMIGYDTGAITGNVTGGIVYTVEGGSAGSRQSRLWEKVDILNKTGSALSLSLAGLGFRPTQASLEVPDLSGLNLVGKTVVVIQGNPQGSSITDPPFAPVALLPMVTFSGFNPLFSQNFSLPAGATLTMMTELRVGPPELGIGLPPPMVKLPAPP